MKINYLDLFSGIGGFALGLQMAGIEFNNHFYSEIDDYAIKVYKKHYPKATALGSITDVRGDEFGCDIDIITAGFPCQDISVAGKQAGLEGARSGLFYEIIRLAKIVSPRVIFLENVANLLNIDDGTAMGEVLRALAEIGYDAEWHCVPASYVGAPHRRDRIWIVAWNTKSISKQKKCKVREGENAKPCGVCEHVANHNSNSKSTITIDAKKIQKSDIPYTRRKNSWRKKEPEWTPKNITGRSRQWEAEPDVGRVANGVPSRMDRLKALGNAVVPQVVTYITELIVKPILKEVVVNEVT